MRILLLTQKLPRPIEDGYNLRIDHYLRRLADRHEIHLASLEEGSMPDELRERLASVTTFPVRPVPRPPTPVHRLAYALSADHVHDFDPAVLEGLRRLVAANDFDLLWVSGWKMLVYARRLEGVPVFGDVIDEGAREAWIDLGKARDLRSRLYAWKTFLSHRAFERKFFRAADLCAFVSDADAEATRRYCPGLDVRVVHNGVDTKAFAPLDLLPEESTFVFEGSMSHLPNVEGIVWFHREILPRIRERAPDARLWIVGKDPSPEVRALAGPGVEVTGFVEDVRPWLARATVFICPLIGGAGIKNKILQAWAMGRPVVSTPLSCGGLAAHDGENLLVAGGAEAFAAACLRLLREPELRERLGAAGRETAVRCYSWDAKARELEELMLVAAGNGRRLVGAHGSRTDTKQ